MVALTSALHIAGAEALCSSRVFPLLIASEARREGRLLEVGRNIKDLSGMVQIS
jgi:hypothetical protein